MVVQHWRASNLHTLPHYSGFTTTNNISLLNVSVRATGTTVVKVYRVWQYTFWDPIVTGATGVFNVWIMARTTPHNGGHVPNIFPSSPYNTMFPSDVSVGSWCREAATETGIIRRFVRANSYGGSPATAIPSLAIVSTWDYMVPLAEVWNSGHKDSRIQPITLRAGEGFQLRISNSQAGTNLGLGEADLEFTTE